MPITYTPHHEADARTAWPAVEPLAVALFGEGCYAERVAFQRGLFLVVARSGEAIVGFKVGYLDRPRRFTSWLGGVHPGWRRQGIGSALMQRQHAHVAAIGCPKIWTIAAESNTAMIRLNQAHGFALIGRYTNEHGVVKRILERRL